VALILSLPLIAGWPLVPDATRAVERVLEAARPGERVGRALRIAGLGLERGSKQEGGCILAPVGGRKFQIASLPLHASLRALSLQAGPPARA
jgi:hypothetical protein